MATELEKLERAKYYLDQLAEGIDPISGQRLPQDTALNNDRLSKCFQYVSKILTSVIQNGGVAGKAPRRDGLPPFQISQERLAQLELSEEPLGISRFAERINALIDTEQMQKLRPAVLTKWLMAMGYLAEEDDGKGGRHKAPTEKGRAIGMSAEMTEGKGRSFLMVFYDADAQKFLADSLADALAYSQAEKKTAAAEADGKDESPDAAAER